MKTTTKRLPGRRLHRWAAPALAFVLLALAAEGLSAQAWAGRGRLSGTVVDTDGNPIEDATVLLKLDGDGPLAIKTNKKGRWAKAGLAGGAWEVTVSAPGFINSSAQARVGEYDSASQRAPVETRLAPLGSAEAAAVADTTEVDPTAEKIQQANELLGEKNWPEARALLEEVLPEIEGPRKLSILQTIAQTHAAEQQIDKAIATLDKALEIAPDDVDALNLAARTLMSAGREADAQAYLDRLPEGAAVDTEVLLRKGVEAYNNNDIDAALEAFTAVIENDADNVDAYYYRGLSAMAKQQNDIAISDFKKLIELAPGSPRAAEGKEFLSYLEQ